MKIFIDSGSIEEIEKAAASGVIDGVTTNPSLIAREGKDFKTVIKAIGNLFDHEHNTHCECPVSAEVISVESKEIIAEAKKIAKIHKKVVVKIPLIPEGIKAVKVLSDAGIKTNVTLCFTAAQALLAAKAGATYVSPFIGRLNDIDQRGLDLIREIKQIFTNYDIETQILAASIRSPRQVVEVALIGADVVTVPYRVFEKLFVHPLTDKGLKQFLNDWNKYKQAQ